MWRNRVHLGDCLTVLSAMPADYVDLIVTSPPYADARKHIRRHRAGPVRRVVYHAGD